MSCRIRAFALECWLPGRRGQAAASGQAGYAQFWVIRPHDGLGGAVGSRLPQPTTQRASEILNPDDCLIDTSDRTTMHLVRGD